MIEIVDVEYSEKKGGWSFSYFPEGHPEDSPGEEGFVNATLAVCPRCRGKGKHTNPAVDGNGISREDFDEDPDFREAYMDGLYDVTCHECNGLRVVPVLPADDNTDPVTHAFIESQHEAAIFEDRCRREQEYESRMLGEY